MSSAHGDWMKTVRNQKGLGPLNSQRVVGWWVFAKISWGSLWIDVNTWMRILHIKQLWIGHPNSWTSTIVRISSTLGAESGFTQVGRLLFEQMTIPISMLLFWQCDNWKKIKGQSWLLLPIINSICPFLIILHYLQFYIYNRTRLDSLPV